MRGSPFTALWPTSAQAHGQLVTQLWPQPLLLGAGGDKRQTHGPTAHRQVLPTHGQGKAEGQLRRRRWGSRRGCQLGSSTCPRCPTPPCTPVLRPCPRSPPLPLHPWDQHLSTAAPSGPEQPPLQELPPLSTQRSLSPSRDGPRLPQAPCRDPMAHIVAMAMVLRHKLVFTLSKMKMSPGKLLSG